MGYWPAKLVCFLNMIIMVGYGIIDCIIAAQILSAVSGGNMSIAVGIVITALISWLVAVFGMAMFQTYERHVSLLIIIRYKSWMLIASRYAWIPQVIVLLILAGVAGKHFDTSLQSVGESAAVTAGRLSFFSLCLSAPATWAGAGSDFYVYVSPSAKFTALYHDLRRPSSTIKDFLLLSVHRLS